MTGLRSGQAVLKRALDLVGAAVGLVLTAPLLAVLAWLVRRRLGRPVMFRQRRPGLHGEPFVLYKLRTMTDERDPDGELLPDADRLTRFGWWLRATSLDELPELWNVLKGDMSLVGPRPLLMDYLKHYTPEQARRHKVRPGITGLAQVRGRNELDWDERLRLDVEYVDAWSLWLDLRILAQSLFRVLRREGISRTGHATSPRFDAREPKDGEPQ